MFRSAKFRAEQLADTALAHCWKLARAKKAGFFFIQNDLLYHQHNVKGQVVNQLVVPSTRIKSLLEMTHNYTHSSAKRLRERLSYSFYAPRLKSLYNDFVQRCDPCQKRRRITYLDRTPIKPIDRTLLPFMTIHVDVL